MKRFSKSLEEFNQKANRGYSISFSYGIVEFDPEKHPSIDVLVTEGDSLMYECKKQDAESMQLSAASR